jgi:hypothetical protein
MWILLLLFKSCGSGMSDYIEDLSGGYQFIFESKREQLIIGNHSIPCTVLAYSYNDDYILVFQQPIEDCFITSVKNIDTLQFWIVDTKQDSLYGPLRMFEYIQKRKELKVPEKLKLKIEI